MHADTQPRLLGIFCGSLAAWLRAGDGRRCEEKTMNDNNIKTTGIKITGKNNIFDNVGVEGFDTGIDLGETAEGNKFRNADVISSAPIVSHDKKWYEKPFGIVFLSVIAGLIIAFLLHYFGWT